MMSAPMRAVIPLAVVLSTFVGGVALVKRAMPVKPPPSAIEKPAPAVPPVVAVPAPVVAKPKPPPVKHKVVHRVALPLPAPPPTYCDPPAGCARFND